MSVGLSFPLESACCPNQEGTIQGLFSIFEARSQLYRGSTLAWKIPWTEEPGRLQSMGSWRVGHDWPTSLSLFTFHALEKKMATHSSIVAWRIPGMGEPSELPSVGSYRAGHDWSDLAAAAQLCNHLLNHRFNLFFYTGQCANSYNQKDGRVQILGAFKSSFTY